MDNGPRGLEGGRLFSSLLTWYVFYLRVAINAAGNACILFYSALRSLVQGVYSGGGDIRSRDEENTEY